MRFLLLLLPLLLFSADLKRDGGPYIGVGYGTSVLQDNGYYNTDNDTSSVILVYAGAYINEYLSVEIEYESGLSYKKNTQESVDFSFLLINTQAHYPLYYDMFDLFAKFGAGEVNQNSTGFSFVFGVGTAYRYSNRIALKVGYNYYNFDIDINGDNSGDQTISISNPYFAVEVQF